MLSEAPLPKESSEGGAPGSEAAASEEWVSNRNGADGEDASCCDVSTGANETLRLEEECCAREAISDPTSSAVFDFSEGGGIELLSVGGVCAACAGKLNIGLAPKAGVHGDSGSLNFESCFGV